MNRLTETSDFKTTLYVIFAAFLYHKLTCEKYEQLCKAHEELTAAVAHEGEAKRELALDWSGSSDAQTPSVCWWFLQNPFAANTLTVNEREYVIIRKMLSYNLRYSSFYEDRVGGEKRLIQVGKFASLFLVNTQAKKQNKQTKKYFI
mgnify:CR=1 FL=1